MRLGPQQVAQLEVISPVQKGPLARALLAAWVKKRRGRSRLVIRFARHATQNRSHALAAAATAVTWYRLPPPPVSESSAGS